MRTPIRFLPPGMLRACLCGRFTVVALVAGLAATLLFVDLLNRRGFKHPLRNEDLSSEEALNVPRRKRMVSLFSTWTRSHSFRYLRTA